MVQDSCKADSSLVLCFCSFSNGGVSIIRFKKIDERQMAFSTMFVYCVIAKGGHKIQSSST